MSPSVKARCLVWCLCLCWSLKAQPASVRDCVPVLAKDYFSYAEKNNLQEDFLRTIDSESWRRVKEDASMGGSAYGGLFSGSNTYSQFDEQRNSYLERLHYTRNSQQALNILQITTGDRAYKAYESCLKSIATGPALVVWASRETMDEIDLRVRYINAPEIKEMDLYGTVTGGSVDGEPQGMIWSKGGTFRHNNRWGINQEKPFVIKRTPGTGETNLTVKAADGSPPFSQSFKRADGLLTLSYIGTLDAFRRPLSDSLKSPNNDERRDSGCLNYVAMHDGKFCTSRTTVTITTTAPRFLKNATSSCGGGNACAWTYPPVVSISPDQLKASTYIDNWSAPVDPGPAPCRVWWADPVAGLVTVALRWQTWAGVQY